MAALARLVHGMSADLVEPDWPPLTSGEVTEVLSRYSRRPSRSPKAVVVWRSPRPMAAAALVQVGPARLFVKRHSSRVRSPEQVAQEHAFTAHLRSAGVNVPRVLPTKTGATMLVAATEEAIYEVHEVAVGFDLYRDVPSWTPYTSLGHARSAGAALARLHLAAANFDGPPRPPGVLLTSCEVITAPHPMARLRQLLADRPGLAAYLQARRWEDDVALYHLRHIERAQPLLRRLRGQWGHGDWHPSNLTWTTPGPEADVAAIFDLGLANRTYTVHDLALALERSTISWLDLATTGRAEADLEAVSALLDGYESVRPLPGRERDALTAVLPVVHMEYALSEVEYFADVTGNEANADLAYLYLVGHAKWFESSEGAVLTEHLRRRPYR
ncbi:MAG TPA: phosphotransferase [Acidimicrobiales bacterium]|nr:phosphotransferase [Acidimicrobiales bacterium]